MAQKNLYPPPGRLVDLGTHRLHLNCVGQDAPTVVFEAALGASSLSWSLVQPVIGRMTRACAYDRAGFGWSDAGPLPRTADCLADELHALLHRSLAHGPYVLVGHSFGGLVIRAFRARYPDETAGVVLIEPAIAEEWAAPGEARRALIRRGVRLCRYGAAAARWGIAGAVAVLVSLGALGPARVIVKVVSRGGLRREEEEILAPIWKLPPDARRVLGQMWTEPRFFEALGSQIESISESAQEVVQLEQGGYGNLPLVVISAAGSDDRRLRADAALARLSSRGRHVLVAGSGHWVPLDAPAAVIDAIVTLIQQIRAR